MPWDNSPEKRKRDQEVYGDPEYKRNRKLLLRRAGGRCERCGKKTARLQADHVIPVTQGGTHLLANLMALCFDCHARKSATEGGGWRKGRGSGRGRPSDPPPRTGTAW